MNKLHYIFSKYVVNTWEINGWIHGDHGQKTAIVLETFKLFFFWSPITNGYLLTDEFLLVMHPPIFSSEQIWFWIVLMGLNTIIGCQ